MSLPRYPAYQNSKLEWAKTLPEHWAAKHLKRNVRLLTEKTDTRECPVGLENLEGWTGRFIQTESDFQGEGVGFEADDILFGKLRPYLAKVWLADRRGEAIGDFHVLRPSECVIPRFIQYQLLTREVVDLVDGSTYGAKMPRASWGFLGCLELPTPPAEEQLAITNFLDRETAKIDALIAEQQRLIELLQEKRQAFISHAVTKGLNPNAPMKDSGVEWLGEVPEHWDVVQFKKFVDIQNGSDHKQVEQVEGYPVLGSGGVFAYASKFLYDGESVLLGRKGTIDKPLHIIGRFWTVDTMYWTRISLDVSGRFTFYSALNIPFDFYSTNTALPSMTKGALSSHRVTYPPLAEQTQIASFLDRETAKIDTLKAEQQRLIELLQERRSALISAAVTGQIDVRGFVEVEGSEL